MKQQDNYANTLFVYGLESLYQVSAHIVSDIHNEPQIYYLGTQHRQSRLQYVFSHQRHTTTHPERYHPLLSMTQYPYLYQWR